MKTRILVGAGGRGKYSYKAHMLAFAAEESRKNRVEITM